MELKQLEYLVTAVECKSLSKAAEALYTSQPNVSKVIKNLEKELGIEILKRTSRGVCLTEPGEQIYEYARNMLKTSKVIQDIATHKSYRQLRVASYSSNMVANKMTDYYKMNSGNALHIEYLSGTVEEVVEYVHTNAADLGIIYFPKHQLPALNQILSRKGLRFQSFKECRLCLYVGKNHPLFQKDEVEFEDLKALKLVQGRWDYFSVVEQMDIISKGKTGPLNMEHIVHTNSEHVVMNMLKNTDLCNISLDLLDIRYKDADINKIMIRGSEASLEVGYLTRQLYILSSQDKGFLNCLKELFEKECHNDLL